jgi:hypothetical protein
MEESWKDLVPLDRQHPISGRDDPVEFGDAVSTEPCPEFVDYKVSTPNKSIPGQVLAWRTSIRQVTYSNSLVTDDSQKRKVGAVELFPALEKSPQRGCT